MDKLGGGTAKVYNLERHLANGSSQGKFFNTFYIWPASIKEQPCQIEERKRSNLSPV